MGARQVAYDLSWLRAVFHWGTKAGADGVPLLERNPFEGYPMPRERNPARPVLTEEQYQALLSVIGSVNWRAELAVVLANETGHRISAIRRLRWSDVDLEAGRIHWRSDYDKSGFDHVPPISQELVEVLAQARRRAATIGDGWVIPAVRDQGKPCSRGSLDKWFQQAARRLSMPLPPRAGWHSLRRKFATELKPMPLKDLCYLGGWKDQKTLLECYQQPDEAVMREALLTRRPYGPTTVDSAGLNRQSRTMPGLTDLRKLS